MELLRLDFLYSAQRSGFWLSGSDEIPSLLSRQEEPTQHQHNRQNCATDIQSPSFLPLHKSRLYMLEAPDGAGRRWYFMDYVLLLHTKTKLMIGSLTGLLKLLPCTYFDFLAASASSSWTTSERIKTMIKILIVVYWAFDSQTNDA